MAETRINCVQCRHTHFAVHISSSVADQHDYIKLTCCHCGNEQLYIVDMSPEFQQFMEWIGL